MILSPLVSVVTPCFNGAAYLDGYFSGLLSQTYRNIEVVFVNDGSTDSTEQVFRSFEPRLRERFMGRVIYIRQENLGPAAATNAGYAASSGELIAPCDSDDVMLPNRIADHVACFGENPECSLVYGDYYFCDESGQTIGDTGLAHWADPPQGHDVYEALLRHGMFIKCGAYCFRRECLSLLPCGCLNEGDPGQNLRLLLRIAHHKQVAFHAAPVVKIVQRRNSITRAKTATALSHALQSKKIVDSVIAELGCSIGVRKAVELRYLPGELRYYLLTGDSKNIRACVWRALRLGVVNEFFLCALAASFSRLACRWLVRRKFPDWFFETQSAGFPATNEREN